MPLTDPNEHRMQAMERLAEELVDEALVKVQREAGLAIGEAAIEQLRWSLMDELLLTPQGRLRLRRALGDPEVEQSGAVGEGQADPEQERAKQLTPERYRSVPVAALLAEAERRRHPIEPADPMAEAAETPTQSRQRAQAWTDARCWSLAIAAMLHPAPPASPEAVAAERQIRELLDAGRSTLPTDQAFILRRRYDEGATMRSIAAELGCSTDTAHRKLTEALTTLRWHLRGQGVDAAAAAL